MTETPHEVQLSNGHPIHVDFTAAKTLTVDDLVGIREVLSGPQDDIVEVTQEGLNEELPPDLALDDRSAIGLFTGFRQAAVAEEVASGRTYADYRFEVDRKGAITYLDQQLVAKLAIEDEEGMTDDVGDVRLVVSLPPHIQSPIEENSEITRLGPRLRSILFDAEESIRIANPYFDTSHAVISDLASLPRRGVDTRILTRQFETNPKTRRAITEVVEELDDQEQSFLGVRDLYKENRESGTQEFALHAKIVVSDSERCYIGSANLMQTGLTTNFEMGVLVEGPLVNRVVEIFDAAFEVSDHVSIRP